MKITKHFLPIVLILLLTNLTNLGLFSQSAEETVLKNTDVEGLIQLSKELKINDSLSLAAALKLAKVNNWPTEIKSEGAYMQLVGLNDDGSPRYYETYNRIAAQSIGTHKLHSNGSLGLNLEGQNMIIAEWDGGGVRTSHREFGSRVTRKDNASGNNAHSTHVAGTLIASGVSANAKGMAPKASLWAYEWTSDASEMSSAASTGLLVSNHSYGTTTGWSNSSGSWRWYGNLSVSTKEDYNFGFYDTRTREWDKIARLAPYYLIVKAAGNDRNDSRSGSHQIWSGGRWTTTSATRDPDGQDDCISTYGTAKNILTVGAVNDLSNGYVNASGVAMTSFSSWGPTDDGRIKPDIVGNGRGVYSCNSTGNSAYYDSDGTSMSSPSVAGSCLLLQQHYKNVKSNYMRSATLKGLIIHTADEAGTSAGPDYRFGWGLMNSAKAVQVINDTKIQLDELTLNNSAKYEKVVFSNGSTPTRVTICWTDIEGTANSPSLNPTAIKLVNDLDVRLVNANTNATYYPYRLNPLVPSSAATKGDNFRDNVEHIYYSNLPAGNYFLRVTHKGSLSGGKQDFTLIAEGFTEGPRANFSTSKLNGCIGDTIFFTDLSTGGITSWQWTFNGASPASSTQKNPYAVYNNAGVFSATLRGLKGSISDTKSVNITIGDTPDASVLEVDTAYCVTERNSIVLTPTQQNGKWNGGSWMVFIDSCKFKPSQLQPGDYTAVHTLTNSSGCTDVDTITVKIRANPVATLTLEERRMCSNAGRIILSGGMPYGGDYAIDGIPSQRFDPTTLALGARRITYTYVDSNQCEATVDDYIRIEDCTSIDELNGSSKIKVFPNPFTSTIELKNIASTANIKITDVAGKSIDFESSISNSNRFLDLSNSEEGVYFLTIIEEGKVIETLRIVKE